MARICLSLLLCLFLSGCGKTPTTWHGKDITGLMPDLLFKLEDAQGQPVTALDYQGKLVLLYFGFTHCEDLCPTTLTTLTAALHRMGNDATRVRILFVSVDPQRDSPALLRQFATHFAPQVIAASGSDAQLQQLAKRYRVTYSYGDKDREGNYEVYHSSAIFVFDGRGKVRLLLDQQLGAVNIAEDLEQLLNHQGRK